mgnify:CR=1 FL=1
MSDQGVGDCWARDEVNVYRDRGHHESHKRLSAFVWDTSSRLRVPRTGTGSHAFRPTLSEDLAPPELRRCEPGLCGRQARQAPYWARSQTFSLLPLGSTTALMRRGYDDGVSLGECKPHGTSHHIRINRIVRAGTR